MGLIAGNLSAQAPPAPQQQTREKVTLIVKTAKGLTLAQGQALLRGHGATPKGSVSQLDLHIVEVPAQAAAAITKALQGDAQVLRVDEDHTRKWGSSPSDALYPQQWALPKIAWDQAYGVANPKYDAKVAILDTGVDGTHPDLTTAVVPGFSVFDASNGLTDENGHGTWVSSIVAAHTDNLQGIAGVAYDHVQIMPVKVLSADGLGQDSDIIQGVIWAADNGASVILMAFSNPGFSQSLQDAVDYAWSKDIVLVAAAGNDASDNPTFPAGDRSVMGVSATDENDSLAATSNHGQSIFIAAPGVNIQGAYPNNAYVTWSGTSASAAIVAGSAALLRTVDPSLSNGVVVHRLALTADAAGAQDETGNGRVNIARALNETSTDYLQPAGAAPIGDGGPFVGPYRIAGNASISGNVKDQNNNPIGQATVSCSGGCNQAAQTATDASGNFQFSGSNSLKFAGNGPVTLGLTAAKTGCVSQTQNVSLTNGQSLSNIDFVLTCTVATTTSIGAPTITYNANGSVTVTVTPASGTITGNVSLTVDGGASASKALSAGSATFTNADIAALASPGAGDHTLSAAYAAQGTFGPSSATGTLHVNKAQSVTTVTAPNATYDGSAHGATAAVTGAGGLNQTLTVTYSGINATTYGPSTNAPTNAGDYKADASFAGDANHEQSSDFKNFTIAKASSTTTVTVTNAAYDGSPHGATAAVTGAGGLNQTLTVTYSGINATTYGPSTSAPTNAGDYKADASFPGDANHNASGDSKNFTIAKASSTTTVTVTNAAYDGSPHAATATVTGVGGLNQTLTVTYSGTNATTYGPSTNAPTNAGDYKADATFAGDANHEPSSDSKNFTIAKASSTTTITVTDATYDGAPHAATATATGVGGLNQTLTVTYSGTNATTYGPSTNAPTDAGDYKADASFAGDENHDASSDSKTFTIAKAKSTTTVTVADAVYDGNPHAATATVTGAGGLNQTLTVTYSGINGTNYGPSATAPTNAGDYKADASFTGDANHEASSDSKNFSIAKAPSTTTVTAADAVYDGNPHAATAAATGAGGLNQTLTATYTGINGTSYGPSTTAPTNAGDYEAAASFAGDANHNESSGSKNFTIAKAPSTTTVSVTDAVFDGNPHAATAAATGAGGLNQTLTATYTGINGTSYGPSPTAPTNAGDYEADATFAGDANHNGSSGSKNFTIARAPSITTVTASNATYDGNPHGATAKATGAGGLNETLTVTYTGINTTNYGPSTTAPTNAGDYQAAAKYDGDANHTSSNGSQNFNIAKANQAISFGALTSKIYGDPDFTVGATGGASGNPVTFTAAGNCSASGLNGASISITGPGACTVTAHQLGNNNYNPAADVPQAFSIAPNQPPVITSIAGPAAPIQIGGAVSLNVTFTDADAPQSAPYTMTTDWGDAQSSSGTVSLPGTVATPSHVYGSAGIYKITVTVAQTRVPGSDTEAFQSYIVIYDPSAGFVTGGGWIMSPVVPDLQFMQVGGKANFGFVSKYKKGQSVPDGQTEFQFQAGGLNFHSASYDWLVVSGTNAQFKGRGSINGAGDYNFLLTATDGSLLAKNNPGYGIDKFRIKIMARNSDGTDGTTVYDNQYGQSDTDMTAGTALAGGSIQIQAK